MKLLRIVLYFSLIIVSSYSYSSNLVIDGSVSYELKIPKKTALNQKVEASAPNSSSAFIKLLRVRLSDKLKESLAQHAKSINTPTTQALSTQSSYSPVRVNLGMNQVPVLNQGAHGSCVMFATTAAIDAVLQKGDYISQLCQLQLGNYLAEHGYGPSGWDGSSGSFVLGQMDTFGFISKEKQKMNGCGGLTEYPTSHDDPITGMDVESFHLLSEPLFSENMNTNSVVWSPILNLFQANIDRVNTNTVLNDVKHALIEGDRVTFGVLFPAPDLGLAGAVGSYKTNNDTWVLTLEISRDIIFKPDFLAGHEMVITGYDDNAIAKDEKGQEHRGLLTLRNSWGKEMGDRGDFYMSYDYFKLLVFEAHRISHLD